MSHDWRLRADNLRGLHPTRKLILLKLAEHTNPTGWCDLAIDTVADYAAISPDQARRLLRRLERDGLLAIETGGGRSHVNRYWLLFDLPTPHIQRIQADVAARNALPTRRPIRPPLNADAHIPDAAPATPAPPPPPTPTPAPPTPTPPPANPGPHASRTSKSNHPGRDEESILTADHLWAQTLDILSYSTTRPSFDMWLRPTRAVRLDGDILTLATPSAYAVDWLTNRLRRPIERALAQAAGRPIGLHVQHAPRPPN